MQHVIILMISYSANFDMVPIFRNAHPAYNVCSVHRGDTISTSEGYHEYIGGGGGGYLEYIGGCSVHRGDIMIYVGEQVDKSL